MLSSFAEVLMHAKFQVYKNGRAGQEFLSGSYQKISALRISQDHQTFYVLPYDDHIAANTFSEMTGHN